MYVIRRFDNTFLKAHLPQTNYTSKLRLIEEFAYYFYNMYLAKLLFCSGASKCIFPFLCLPCIDSLSNNTERLSLLTLPLFFVKRRLLHCFYIKPDSLKTSSGHFLSVINLSLIKTEKSISHVQYLT